MAKKNTKSVSDRIIDAYMKELLEEGVPPKSMYQFGKKIKVKEGDIYKHFGSFEAIEAHVYKSFFNKAIELLEYDKGYKNYSAKDRLISFYYTFFELLKANRSFVMISLSDDQAKLKRLKKLEQLRVSFKEYIDSLELPKLNLKESRLSKMQSTGMSELAWNQLLVTLRFWMDDSSKDFEKTDLFIEKSLTTWFELIQIEPLEKLIDLGKFVIKEKFGIKA